jgi:HK97 family phage major capsid protein
MNVREMMVKRAALLKEADAILKTALDEGRASTDEENAQVDDLEKQAKAMQGTIDRAERMTALQAELSTPNERRIPAAPAIIRSGLGDNELKATAFYIKHGDASAIKGLAAEQMTDFMAASNDTDMNIGTSADGGYLVPTSHFQGIVAKRNESALFGPLGVTPYNGYRGTTLNVPIETGAANVFVATAESTGAVDRDAPVFDLAALTIVHFTKSLELTNDLRDMEDSALMTFLTNYIGRALAMTHNSALITEALADGTSVTLGAAAAGTAGDPEEMEGALAAEYSDGAFFVMRKATLYKYRKLTGSPFLYQPTPAGALSPRQLGESQVFLSSFPAAIGAGNKSIILGDFEYMGMREIPMTFLYDPYSKANTSRVMLHYRTSLVYKVTNADAILYGKHPTA